MINKSLARRLELLEAEILPGEETIHIIHVHGVERDGKVVSSLEFRGVPIPTRPPKPRFR